MEWLQPLEELECMTSNLVEQTILSYFIEGLAIELEVCFKWFLQTLKQLFKIKNICTNNFPLRVEPLAIWMCFKMELLLHPIPISFCNLTKKFQCPSFGSRYKVWQVMLTMVISFSKLTKFATKSSACRPCLFSHTKLVPHFS